MGFIKKSNAPVFLFLNAFLWGSSYVWSKMLLEYLPRFSILFICSLGGLVSTLAIFYRSIRTIDRSALLPSIITSIFSILSNTFFMFALQYTSSSNTAFIVQTSVILTPLIMAVIEKKMPGGKIILSAFVAMCGLFLLTCDFKSFRLNTGDLLALGNAVFFSIFLASLNVNSKKVNPVHFTFIHHSLNTVVFLCMSLLMESPLINLQKLHSPIFGLLIAASMSVSVITVLVQSAAIKFVRPEKATLIYTFEPVTALLLAFVFIGEQLNGAKSVIGCVLILLSVIYSLYRPKAKRRNAEAKKLRLLIQ